MTGERGQGEGFMPTPALAAGVSPSGPKLTVDAVLLRADQVLLIRRGREPFKGSWALPGGFVDAGETVERACLRELAEETGLKGLIVDLLGVYSDPARDPRHHTVSVVFVCGVGGLLPGIDAGDDAEEAAWFPLDALPPLAFDHGRICEDAQSWLARGGLARLIEATDSC